MQGMYDCESQRRSQEQVRQSDACRDHVASRQCPCRPETSGVSVARLCYNRCIDRDAVMADECISQNPGMAMSLA